MELADRLSWNTPLPRSFRFYVKKRGARRTDSSQLGNVVRVLLSALLFFGGIGFAAYLLATLIVPEWRVNRTFRETTCQVLGKRLLEVEQRDGTWMFRPEFHVAYEVGDETYQARTYDIARAYSTDREREQRVLDQFDVNASYPCWYDPRDPSSAVLVRGYTWSTWLLLLVPITFMAAGGGGLSIALLNWGKSVERRASLARRTVPIEIFGEVAPHEELPTVPQRVSHTESPGTRLAYRLPMDARPLWLLAALCALLAVIVSVAGLLTALGLLRLIEGRPDWMFLVFAGSWLVIGVVGLLYAARHLVRATSAGPTILEISHHPVMPGQAYELFLRQPGRGQWRRLALSLVCEERATSQQGTNTRTEVRRVLNSEITSQSDVQLSGRKPFEGRFTLELPRHAMHSFRSPHNSVEWKLLLAGRAQRGFDFERSFPIIVCPSGEEAGCTPP
jgi:hypothetical protein